MAQRMTINKYTGKVSIEQFKTLHQYYNNPKKGHILTQILWLPDVLRRFDAQSRQRLLVVLASTGRQCLVAAAIVEMFHTWCRLWTTWLQYTDLKQKRDESTLHPLLTLSCAMVICPRRNAPGGVKNLKNVFYILKITMTPIPLSLDVLQFEYFSSYYSLSVRQCLCYFLHLVAKHAGTTYKHGTCHFPETCLRNTRL